MLTTRAENITTNIMDMISTLPRRLRQVSLFVSFIALPQEIPHVNMLFYLKHNPILADDKEVIRPRKEKC